jgi:hypothetical protein
MRKDFLGPCLQLTGILAGKKMIQKVRYLTTDPFAYFDLRPFDCDQVRHGGQCRQYKFAQDKFFVFSLTISTMPYKYMYICLCAAVWYRNQVVFNMETSSYG